MAENVKLAPLEAWDCGFHKPLIIAGPCSAETEEQVLQTAQGLIKSNVSVFRAGIWKPRTRPNSFEGVGSIGLRWLKEVTLRTGLLTSTEVANYKHVEEALKYGINILWIGARTTANPFAVQEIADSLKGVKIPILIKNPINPDLNLWLGAVERISQAGIEKIGLIHRGFSSYSKSNYRNQPRWQLPLDLKKHFPLAPLIGDPSHMGGDVKHLLDLSQKCFDMNYDGLMIETHVNPKTALSDVDQQITPDELISLLSKLVYKDTNLQQDSSIQELLQLATKLDDEILNVIKQRIHISKSINHLYQEDFLNEVNNLCDDKAFKNSINNGLRKGFSEEFMVKLMQIINQESSRF